MVPVYVARCETAWDGDGHGAEWRIRVRVQGPYELHEVYGGGLVFKVYQTDDEAGAGDMMAEFSDVRDARRYADLTVRWLDAGGYADSPILAEMARLVMLRGVVA